MSLDVYLEAEAPHVEQPGIFIRRDGSTVEISRDEWNILYPDREPVETMEHETTILYSANITHNLNRMAQVGSSGIARSGSTTDAHLAVWNGSNADSLKDGGAVSGTVIRSHFKWDDPPASPHANDDEFNGSLDAKWGGWKSSGAPANVTTTNGLLQFDLPTGTGKACVVYQTPPAATSWTITTKVYMDMINEDARAILFAGTSGGTVQVATLRDWIASSGVLWGYETWTHATGGAWSAPTGVQTSNDFPFGWIWLRLAWDNAGTTIYFLISKDGHNWLRRYGQGSVTAPNIFGLGGLRNAAGTNQPHIKFDYFRCLSTFSPFVPANGEAIDFTA